MTPIELKQISSSPGVNSVPNADALSLCCDVKHLLARPDIDPGLSVAGSKSLNHYIRVAILCSCDLWQISFNLMHNKKMGKFLGFSHLNLENVPAAAGKTKLKQFPATAGKSPCYSREMRLVNISLLWQEIL